MAGGQPALNVLQVAGRLDHPFGGVVDQRMVNHFNIFYPVRGDAVQPVGDVDEQVRVAVMAAAHQRPLERRRKAGVGHRLEQEIHGLHRVALGGVPGQVGDKNQRDRPVHQAQLFRGGHAADARQVNVHHHQVIDGLVAVEKRVAALEPPDIKFLPGVRGIPGKMRPEDIRLGRIVLHNRNHSPHKPHALFYSMYSFTC